MRYSKSLFLFALGFFVGTLSAFALAQEAVNVPKDFTPEPIVFSDIKFEKGSFDDLIQKKISTSTLSYETGYKLVSEEFQTKEITKRLDRIIELLEKR